MHPQHLVFSCFLHPKWGIPRFLRQLQVRRVSLSSTCAYGIHPQDESSQRGPGWTKENMQDRWKFLQFLHVSTIIFLDKKTSSRNSWKFDLNGGFTRDHIGIRRQLKLPGTANYVQISNTFRPLAHVALSTQQRFSNNAIPKKNMTVI